MRKSIMQLLCTFECAIRIDELWDTLKDHYTGQNSMINKEITVKELRDKIANTSPTNLGSLNQTCPPYGSSCYQIRKRTNFEEIARRKWESWSFEAMRREEPEPSEVENRIKYLVNIMYERELIASATHSDVTTPERPAARVRPSSSRTSWRTGCR